MKKAADIKRYSYNWWRKYQLFVEYIVINKICIIIGGYMSLNKKIEELAKQFGITTLGLLTFLVSMEQF